MISISKHLENDSDDLRINANLIIPSRATVAGRIKVIKIAFLQHIRVNTLWANRLVFCECLTMINLFLQIYATNRFLGGHFYTLGPEFIRDDFKGVMDTLDLVFPKVTKCLFHKYGASGTIQNHDALCVMALNVINEKIFVFLWFWYVILLAVTTLALIWRIATWILHSRYV